MRKITFKRKYLFSTRFAYISIISFSLFFTLGALIYGFGIKTPDTTASLLPGALDPSFDGDGIVVTDIAGGDDQILAAITQPDGKIVVAGSDTVGPINDFALARYNRDGSLDTSFSGDGKLTTLIQDYSLAADLAIQPDGKIIAVGGSHLNQVGYFALARYNTDGSLDTTFDGDGIAAVSPDNHYSSALAVALQSDNKIVVAGSSLRNSAYEVFTLARFNPNGSLDTSFGTGGYVSTSFGNMAWANDVAIQPSDGKIIAAGFAPVAGNWDFALIRYNTNGSLDTSFGIDGKSLTPIGPYADAIRKINLQPNGKIVAAGWSRRNANYNDFAVARFNPNGSLDTTFDVDGKVTVQMSTINSEATSLDIDKSGKITVVGNGWTDPQPGSFYGVVRLNANGSLDTSFHEDGRVTTQLLGTFATPSDVVVQPDGRIVVAGTVSGGANADFAVVRYIGTARAVADFDGDGRTDLSVFRPDDGYWYIDGSSTGFNATKWGNQTDQIVPGDYDGDGKADLAVWRPSANDADADFYILNSNGSTYSWYSFGLPGDMPMTGDFDGDGRVDIVVYRPSTNVWWMWETSTRAVRSEQFGAPGDVPLVMDNDGDGKSHISVYRPGDRFWYVAKPMANPAQNFDAIQWGLSDDIFVPADYDGDGKDDIAVFRPTDGMWYVRRSSDGGYSFTQFGMSGDVPVPGDYDGDGKADQAVYRNGIWYMNGSTSGFTALSFGLSTDRPVPAAYHP